MQLGVSVGEGWVAVGSTCWRGMVCSWEFLYARDGLQKGLPVGEGLVAVRSTCRGEGLVAVRSSTC